MPLLSSRRRPWPYHMRMGSILGATADRIGLMLLPNQQGLLIGRKQQMLDSVVPSVQEYASAPVYRERTWPCKPTAGYGERVQSSFGDKRYYWGNDVTVSGGLVGKGPLLHPTAPSTAAGSSVWKIIDGYNTASLTLTQFVCSGTKVYRRTDDTNAGQVVDKDFTPNVVNDAAVFQGGFAGATKSLYIATNGGTVWERTPSRWSSSKRTARCTPSTPTAPSTTCSPASPRRPTPTMATAPRLGWAPCGFGPAPPSTAWT